MIHVTDENLQEPKDHPDFWNIWDYIPPAVRPYFVKRVCVFGPRDCVVFQKKN